MPELRPLLGGPHDGVEVECDIEHFVIFDVDGRFYAHCDHSHLHYAPGRLSDCSNPDARELLSHLREDIRCPLPGAPSPIERLRADGLPLAEVQQAVGPHGNERPAWLES